MTSNISSISSVQWTDFHDTSRTTAQITSTRNEVLQLAGNVNLINAMATLMSNRAPGQTFSVSTYADSFSRGDNYSFASYTMADGEAYLRLASTPVTTAIKVLNPDTGWCVWVVKERDGSIIYPHITWMPGSSNSQIVNALGNWAAIENRNADQLMAQINSILGTNYNRNTQLKTEQWVAIAAKLKELTPGVIAAKSSTLAIADGGGIKYFNGKWYVNGQTYTYMQVYMAARVNTLYNINTQNAVLLNRVQKRNIDIARATWIMSKINAIMPTNTTDTVLVAKINEITTAYQVKYDTTDNPFSIYMPTAWSTAKTGTSFRQTQMQTWTTELQSYITTAQTENSTMQAYLQELTNKQTETTESISNMVKSQSNQASEIARNFNSV